LNIANSEYLPHCGDCVLPDYLKHGLDIVFVGTAASDVSAARKHYYSGYNNAFYTSIYQAGIVCVRLGPEDDWRLPTFGIGLTDVVKNRHTGDDSHLSKSELSDGAPSLRERILTYGPRIVCFNGKNAYKAFAGHRCRQYGPAEIDIGTSKVFVVPSTSGRVNAEIFLDGKTRLQWFEELAQFRDAGR
jgi:double-stranded uracil-DNA glycosylase